ncbi:MAG TPA: MarC family protein [Verrucomicrobiae bacterium]
MSTSEYLLLALSSLFVIMDPIGLVPLFLAMTPGDTVAQRVRMARMAAIIAAAVLMVFALGGQWVFKLLGISLPAFQMAGCVVLLIIALDMLKAQRSQVSPEEAQAGMAKDDIAITPLAIPMLAGPGSITTTMLMQSRAESWPQHIGLYVVIGVVCFSAYLILRWAAHGAKRLSPLVMKIVQRLMGLLLAAIAFQFLINAINELRQGS